MKGSREKQGKPPLLPLSVTWAPDVYDPIPTSLSHFPSSKNQRRKSGRYKKGGGGGGKSSRGSKSKDKKQGGRKNSGSSTNSKLKPFHEDSGVSFVEPQVATTVEFNVGNPDQFCGSSFLKNSFAELHFPVAEAT